MIRLFASGDLDQVADIWLSANCQAHSFIPASYWTGQLEGVQQALPQAEVYVWEENGSILGFLGLDGEYIAGIFVRPGEQSKGIGTRLLNHAKSVRDRLTLCVYEKNAQAAAFYRREGFAPLEQGADQATGEAEYRMGWTRQNGEENLC